MVGHIPLEDGILVRVQVRQPSLRIRFVKIEKRMRHREAMPHSLPKTLKLKFGCLS